MDSRRAPLLELTRIVVSVLRGCSGPNARGARQTILRALFHTLNWCALFIGYARDKDSSHPAADRDIHPRTRGLYTFRIAGKSLEASANSPEVYRNAIRYAMRLARSFSFLSPAKLIFVPGRYFLGFSTKSLRSWSVHSPPCEAICFE